MCSFYVVRCGSVFQKAQKFIRNQLTSHAIVGEPLAELIHHDEEDAYRVIKQSLLQGEKTLSLIWLHSFVVKYEQNHVMAYLQN